MSKSQERVKRRCIFTLYILFMSTFYTSCSTYASHHWTCQSWEDHKRFVILDQMSSFWSKIRSGPDKLGQIRIRSGLDQDQIKIGLLKVKYYKEKIKIKKLILIFWALILQQLRGGYVGSVTLHFTEAEVSITMGRLLQNCWICF